MGLEKCFAKQCRTDKSGGAQECYFHIYSLLVLARLHSIAIFLTVNFLVFSVGNRDSKGKVSKYGLLQRSITTPIYFEVNIS